MVFSIERCARPRDLRKRRDTSCVNGRKAVKISEHRGFAGRRIVWETSVTRSCKNHFFKKQFVCFFITEKLFWLHISFCEIGCSYKRIFNLVYLKKYWKKALEKHIHSVTLYKMILLGHMRCK